jgi:hypothetical protein
MTNMENSEIKKLIITSLENEEDGNNISDELQQKLSYDFRDGFEEKVLDKIFDDGIVTMPQLEYDRNLNLAFYRIALTGAAAIILLVISLFLNGGSLSFDSMLGLNDGYSESIVCLLTGN